jgi:hypothetical protein
MDVMNRRFHFRISHLLLAIVVGALFSCLLIPHEARSYKAAIRNQYISGRITLEEARREVGDTVDTDDWPRLKAEWQAKQNQ